VAAATDGPRWLREQIVNKTNDTNDRSKCDHATLENLVLADSELDTVSGGAEAKDIVASAVLAAVAAILPHGV
jgi:hypothetical protein